MVRGSSTAPLRIGVFNTVEGADRAVSGLVQAGFQPHEISVICPTCSPEKYREYHRTDPAGSHNAAGALKGGAIGGFLGGLVAVGVAATGGAALLAVGPLLLTAGAGATTGGLVGAMLTRGMENEDANYYDQALQRGNILVSIECEGPGCEDRLAAAERVFAGAGAVPLALEEG